MKILIRSESESGSLPGASQIEFAWIVLSNVWNVYFFKNTMIYFEIGENGLSSLSKFFKNVLL